MCNYPFLRLTALCAVLFCGLSAVRGKDGIFSGGFLSQNKNIETTEYRDLEAGENALRSGNYETAADYFREYRLKANLNGDASAAEDAIGHELHACIAANLVERAQKLLDEFRTLYPGKTYDSMLYQAQIYLAQRRYDDAKKIVTALHRDMSAPVTLQNLLCEVAIAEHEKDNAKALEIYNEIVRQTGRKTTVGGRADERKVLLLIGADRLEDARAELKLLLQARSEAESIPVRDLDVNQLFLFFCDLKESPASALPDKLLNDWNEKIRKSPHSDEIFHLVVSGIAEIFAQRKDMNRCAEAYYLAQQCAPVREDAVQSVVNLLAVYNSQPDKKQAAAYAEDMLRLFSLSDVTLEQGVQIARILFAGDRKEKGIDVCLQILKSLPESRMEEMYRLSLYMTLETESYVEAKQLITISGSLLPAKSVSFAFDYARVLELEKNYADAVKKYDEILKMPALTKEEKINALQAAARISDEAGEYDDVIRFGTLLLQNDPSQISGLTVIGEAEMQMKKYRDAYSHFSEFVKRAPRNTDKERETISSALYRAAQCALKSGDNDNVIRMLEILTGEFPKSTEYIQGMALLSRSYFRIDEGMKARSAANVLYDAFPDNRDAIKTMLFAARQFFSSQEYGVAEQILGKLRENKTMPEVQEEACYLSARIAMEKNDMSSAMLYLDEMKKITAASEQLNLSAHLLQGEIYRKNKSFEKAEKEYKEILKTAPNTLAAQIAQQSIGDIYFEEALLQPAFSADNDPAEREKMESRKSSDYGTALAEYKKMLLMIGLTPEMKAIACYKIANVAGILGKKDEVAEALLGLYALSDARQADLHPEIAYWIIRGVLLAEDIANTAVADYGIMRAAEQGLNWLGDSGKITMASRNARIGKLRKLPQYQKTQPMKDK